MLMAHCRSGLFVLYELKMAKKLAKEKGIINNNVLMLVVVNGMMVNVGVLLAKILVVIMAVIVTGELFFMALCENKYQPVHFFSDFVGFFTSQIPLKTFFSDKVFSI